MYAHSSVVFSSDRTEMSFDKRLRVDWKVRCGLTLHFQLEFIYTFQNFLFFFTIVNVHLSSHDNMVFLDLGYRLLCLF